MPGGRRSPSPTFLSLGQGAKGKGKGGKGRYGGKGTHPGLFGDVFHTDAGSHRSYDQRVARGGGDESRRSSVERRYGRDEYRGRGSPQQSYSSSGRSYADQRRVDSYADSDRSHGDQRRVDSRGSADRSHADPRVVDSSTTTGGRSFSSRYARELPWKEYVQKQSTVEPPDVNTIAGRLRIFKDSPPVEIPGSVKGQSRDNVEKVRSSGESGEPGSVRGQSRGTGDSGRLGKMTTVDARGDTEDDGSTTSSLKRSRAGEEECHSKRQKTPEVPRGVSMAMFDTVFGLEPEEMYAHVRPGKEWMKHFAQMHLEERDDLKYLKHIYVFMRGKRECSEQTLQQLKWGEPDWKGAVLEEGFPNFLWIVSWTGQSQFRAFTRKSNPDLPDLWRCKFGFQMLWDWIVYNVDHLTLSGIAWRRQWSDEMKKVVLSLFEGLVRGWVHYMYPEMYNDEIRGFWN